MSIQTVEVGRTCRVFTQISDSELATATGCPSPSGKTVVFQPLGNNIRWRPDGNDPTSSVGFQLVAGNIYSYTGDLRKVRFIREAAGATLNVAVFD